jgi:hypothetical protein
LGFLRDRHLQVLCVRTMPERLLDDEGEAPARSTLGSLVSAASRHSV